MDTKKANELAQLLQTVGEPTRLQLLCLLTGGAKNVTQLATILNIPIVNISHHLSVLKMGGVLHKEKRGRFVYYSILPTRTTFVSTITK